MIIHTVFTFTLAKVHKNVHFLNDKNVETILQLVIWKEQITCNIILPWEWEDEPSPKALKSLPKEAQCC